MQLARAHARLFGCGALSTSGFRLQPKTPRNPSRNLKSEALPHYLHTLGPGRVRPKCAGTKTGNRRRASLSWSSMRGRVYAGTSGFAYKTWKPGFYPPRLKTTDMLRYYAERLPSVEINNTFYRMPTEKLLAAWRDETAETFTFTLKAPQRITHIARLRDVADPLGYFLKSARSLGPRLGCILFQCPPYLRYDA